MDSSASAVTATATPLDHTTATATPPALDADLLAAAAAKIALGQRLHAVLAGSFHHIDGAAKIERKIAQEVRFLERVRKSGQLKANHVLCSNLVHYDALALVLQRSRAVKHIDYPVAMAGRESPLRVDIVCDGGRTWVKGKWQRQAIGETFTTGAYYVIN